MSSFNVERAANALGSPAPKAMWSGMVDYLPGHRELCWRTEQSDDITVLALRYRENGRAACH